MASAGLLASPRRLAVPQALPTRLPAATHHPCCAGASAQWMALFHAIASLAFTTCVSLSEDPSLNA
jgi:hypothetical protein